MSDLSRHQTSHMPIEMIARLDEQEWVLLKSAPLLASMSDAVVNRLIKGQVPKTLDRGTLLFHQGQPANQVHVVLRGWIKLFRTGETGAEAVIRIAGPGEMAGEDGLIFPHGHPVSAEAISQVRVLPIDASRIVAQMRRDPALALSLAECLSAQVQFLTKHVEEMKLLDAQQRTAHFLLGLCQARSGACCITLPYEKSVIASWLGMKPASLSRALSRLRRFGVTVDRDAVKISDAGKLAKLSHVRSDERMP